MGKLIKKGTSEYIKCSSRDCKNEGMHKIYKNRPTTYCLKCFEAYKKKCKQKFKEKYKNEEYRIKKNQQNDKRKNEIYLKAKEAFDKGEKVFCSHKKCCNKKGIAVYITRGEQAMCKKAFNAYKIKIAEKVAKEKLDEVKWQLTLAKQTEARTKAKQKELAEVLTIAEQFGTPRFSLNNINEYLVRDHIFTKLENLIGLKWKNEEAISLTTDATRQIDVFLPEHNIFIEYKNTTHTQSKVFFKNQMEEHVKWIESSRFNGAMVISVSTNGSMCDYNIIQFMQVLSTFFDFMYKATREGQYLSKKTKLNHFIDYVEMNAGHLMKKNRWAELTTDKIIEHMLNNKK